MSGSTPPLQMGINERVPSLWGSCQVCRQRQKDCKQCGNCKDGVSRGACGCTEKGQGDILVEVMVS